MLPKTALFAQVRASNWEADVSLKFNFSVRVNFFFATSRFLTALFSQSHASLFSENPTPRISFAIAWSTNKYARFPGF